jgi:hypothetical protein
MSGVLIERKEKPIDSTEERPRVRAERRQPSILQGEKPWGVVEGKKLCSGDSLISAF